MKNERQKASAKKKITIGIAMTLLIIALGGITWLFALKTTVVEDISNSCGSPPEESDGQKMQYGSTTATKKLVYKEIPNYSLNSYMKEARSEGRCVQVK